MPRKLLIIDQLRKIDHLALIGEPRLRTGGKNEVVRRLIVLDLRNILAVLVAVGDDRHRNIVVLRKFLCHLPEPFRAETRLGNNYFQITAGAVAFVIDRSADRFFFAARKRERGNDKGQRHDDTSNLLHFSTPYNFFEWLPPAKAGRPPCIIPQGSLALPAV